jgi:hypothetical protein
MGTNSEIAVVAFSANGHHVCSCRKLSRDGIVCVHFFAVLQRSSLPKFHIGLLPSRWYRDSALGESISDFPVLHADGVVQDVAACIFLDVIRQKSLNAMEPAAQQRSKVQRFGEVWGKSREASLLSVELNDSRLNHFLTQLVAELREEKSKRGANKVCKCDCLTVLVFIFSHLS